MLGLISLINKFIDIEHPAGRATILGLQVNSNGTPHLAFGILTDSEVYKYSNSGNGWVEEADLKIDEGGNGAYTDEWICVEVETAPLSNEVKIYIDTQDGAFTGEYVTGTKTQSVMLSSFYWSYYNLIVGADADSHIGLDNIRVDSSFIGCPTGFGS